jgi:hypothetical protein
MYRGRYALTGLQSGNLGYNEARAWSSDFLEIGNHDAVLPDPEASVNDFVARRVAPGCSGSRLSDRSPVGPALLCSPSLRTLHCVV